MLHADEAVLVGALLDMCSEGALLAPRLADARVHEMADSGMSSLTFVSRASNRKAREIVSVRSSDEDGVPLEISLNVDQHGALFELDIWKVDFSRLRRLPTPQQLRKQ